MSLCVCICIPSSTMSALKHDLLGAYSNDLLPDSSCSLTFEIKTVSTQDITCTQLRILEVNRKYKKWEHRYNFHTIKFTLEGLMSSRNPPLPELKKVGSTGSTLPEHPRFSPGTHKASNYLKDVWMVFQAICSVKIARFSNISLLVPGVENCDAP